MNGKSPSDQSERFKQVARELECDEDEARFNENLKRIAKSGAKTEKKVCPECGHVFRGNGWDGIDVHWRSRHENIMPYEEAWPLIQSGKYDKDAPRK